MRSRLRFPFQDAAWDARIAAGRRELAEAFELVYRCYLAKDYIQPHPGGILYREAFGLTSSRTIIAEKQAAGGRQQAGKIVGTLTVVGDNPLGLELETTYPREVQSLRDSARSLAEITCLAIQLADESQRRRAVFFKLTQLMIHYAYWRGYDDLLIAIHPRHHRFYRRYFRVLPLGPCRPHRFVSGNPAICCRIDLHNLKRNVNPELWRRYFSQFAADSREIGPPMDTADHHYFCRRMGIPLHTDHSGRSTWHKDAA